MIVGVSMLTRKIDNPSCTSYGRCFIFTVSSYSIALLSTHGGYKTVADHFQLYSCTVMPDKYTAFRSVAITKQYEVIRCHMNCEA